MYTLATFLRELRQDWSLHVIQTALADVQHLPFDKVAPAAVRAACDPNATNPRVLEQFVKAAVRAGSNVGPPRLCKVCSRPHDPENPDAHVIPPPAEVATRGAALVRAALRESVTAPQKAPPVAYDEPALDLEEPERERYP